MHFRHACRSSISTRSLTYSTSTYSFSFFSYENFSGCEQVFVSVFRLVLIRWASWLSLHRGISQHVSQNTFYQIAL
ncbi:Uncharacterized protein APZ42_018458 [Daphnia magna]|uniref:Uncharacterized protein n=1 Tax=Daphnia magna TaxID=35525 RepID=A0A0P5UGN2_9CRUS|nr:Uncharacterized protein APZ42_018458 [Daphnia magna]